MEWTDEGIVLTLRPHGETSAVLEVLTRGHGRHLGLVYGGASGKRRGVLQPGNKLRVIWRARLAEHLGSFTVEPVRLRAAQMFDERAALAGLNALVGVAAAVLPEREPHGPAFEGADQILDLIAEYRFEDWAPSYVRWELGLLDELGFGLDLSACAGTGSTENLVYVSPRTGRAVSSSAGAPYRDRLLALPAFLSAGSNSQPSLADILAGLNLTQHFIEQSVIAPHDRTLPEARRRLTDFAAKAAASPLSASESA